jgi:rhomboid family GlyGly-CTERM serine protease
MNAQPASAACPLPGSNVRRSVTSLLARQPELGVFLVIIILLNLPVLFGSCFQSLIFQPAAVGAGQWWRVLTHPFVHVTWYHFLLDGSAFVCLYAGLLESRMVRRLGYMVAAVAGSLAASWAVSAPGSVQSLCGLSGIAHGLMAVSALEMVRGNPPASAERRMGWITLGLVVGKAAFEAISGRMFFAFLDFGLLGSPVAVSHAGGIVGGLAAMGVQDRFGMTESNRDSSGQSPGEV